LNDIFHWFAKPYSAVKRSLYRKMLLAFLSILLVTVTLLGVNYYVQTSEMIKDQAVLSMERLSEQSESTLSSYMRNMKNFSWNYFGDPNFQQFVKKMGSDPAAFSYYLSKFAQFRNDNPMVDFILACQLNGNQLMVGGEMQEAVLHSEMIRLQKLAVENDGKGQWIPTVTDARRTGETAYTLVYVQALKEVKVDSRPVIGVFMLRLSDNYIREWLNGILPADQGKFRLAQLSDGRVIVASDRESVGKAILSERDMNRLKDVSGYFMTRENGARQLVVYRKLADVDWVLIGKVPVRAMLAEVDQVANQTILIAGVGLLISMMLASLLSSRIVVPLKRLRVGMKAIETGNYGISIPVQTDDEIGYMTAGFNKMAHEMNRMIVQVYESELVKKDAVIKALQSQINPHFLYNTLGTIEGIALEYGDDRIGYISRSLAKMFRYNISEGSFSTLRKEIRQIEMYLSIQKIRLGDRLTYSTSIEDGLSEVVVPKLLFQPLVENSILHGIDRLQAGGTVCVRIVSEGEDIEIRVWNNGPPIDDSKRTYLEELLESSVKPFHVRETVDSIGLENVQQRVRLLYGPAYGLTIVSAEGTGTEFILRIHQRLRENGEST